VSAERYTAVFTGAFAEKKPGEYLYLTMSEDPLGPGGSQTLHRGRPLSERLAHEVPFKGFPAGCRVLILDAYRRLWDL
jgi:hypothetical protein